MQKQTLLQRIRVLLERNEQIPGTLQKIQTELQLLRKEVAFLRNRISTYVGEETALTYLPDETPIYVNSNDFFGPANLLNGGSYEPDNLAILMSFVRDDTVFLDIGANVGFFSLTIGRRVMRLGKVHAFEPHPRLQHLLKGSALLNGLQDTIRIHPIGLSDSARDAAFHFTKWHLGGGTIEGEPSSTQEMVHTQVHPLDDYMADDFRCDLVKIDVEGHELQVLRGMQRIIARSPRIAILFEKLATDAGYEDALEALLRALSLNLYSVSAGALLSALPQGGLSSASGYFLATRDALSGAHLSRSRMTIFPRQFLSNGQAITEIRAELVSAQGKAGVLLLHGPYWILPEGTWRWTIDGEIQGQIKLVITTRMGQTVEEYMLRGSDLRGQIVAAHDLVQFECAFYAASAQAAISLRRMEFVRVP